MPTSTRTPYEAFAFVRERFPFPGYMVDSKPYVNVARTVSRYLPASSRILDFGAGPCDKTAVLQNMGYRCVAFDDLCDDWHKLDDNRQKIRGFAKDMGIEFELATIGPPPFEPESFDMVMAHDVIEHLHDSPRELFNGLLALAKPRGYLFVTVPNAANVRKRIWLLFGRSNMPSFASYFWYPGMWRGHVREYVRNDLVLFCKYLNLKICELRSCHHMLHILPKWLRPAYRAIVAVFTGWRDNWLLVARKTPDWRPARLPRQEIERILGRHTPYAYGQQGGST